MIKCQSHQDLNYEHKTKHRKVLLWGNTLVSVIIKGDWGTEDSLRLIMLATSVRHSRCLDDHQIQVMACSSQDTNRV